MEPVAVARAAWVFARLPLQGKITVTILCVHCDDTDE